MMRRMKAVLIVISLVVILATAPSHVKAAEEKQLRALVVGRARTQWIGDVLKPEGVECIISRTIDYSSLKEFDIVVISSSCLKLSEDDNEKIKNYLAEGGQLVLTGQVPRRMTEDNSLSQIEEWFGATGYGCGNHTATRIVGEDVLTKSLEVDKSYEWYGGKRVIVLGKVTTGKVLATLVPAGRLVMMVNYYGKGRVIYSGFLLDITKDTPDEEKYLELLRNIVKTRGTAPYSTKTLKPNFLVKKKSKTGFIILGDSLSPKDKATAGDLSSYLEKITGSPVPVLLGTSQEVEGLKIHIGKTSYVESLNLDLENLFMDGYIIKLVDEDNLVIVGGEHLGTGIGIYDFLKIFCGVRWFMPGPLGEVIPKKEQIVLDHIDIRSEPDVQSVWLRPIAIDNLKVKHFRRYHWAGHNLKRLVPPEKYGRSHPEYYPLIKGERRVPLGKRFPWQPCVSNRDIPKFVVDVAREHFQKNPYSKVFSVGVNDGGGDCLCDNCKTLDVVNNNVRYMSDRYILFYNRCAEEFAKVFPDKLLGFHAYGGVRFPPFREKPKENLYIRICGMPNVLQQFEGWSRKVKHMGIYDFFYGTPILEPRYYPHILGNYVKTLVDKYHILNFSAEVFPFWPFDAPKYYILSELIWDAEKDVDKLIDDYFQNFYQESAKPMKSFFNQIEKVYMRRSDPYNFFAGYRRGGFKGWTLSDLQHMDKELLKAKKLAKEEMTRTRITIVDDAYQHIKCWMKIYVYTKELEKMEISSKGKIRKAMDYARKIFQNMEKRDKWDEKVKDKSRYPSGEYYDYYVAKHYAEPGSLVQTDTEAEDAIEHAFSKISKWYLKTSGIRTVKKFWQDLAELNQGARISTFAKTQLYLLDCNFEVKNVIEDGSFEDTSRARVDMDKATLEKYRWEVYKGMPRGYAVWSFTGRPAEFVWTDRLAHTGKRCVGIENNTVQACIIRHTPVKPGERYLISIFANQVWEENIRRSGVRPELTIAWQNKGGWTKDPRITRELSGEEAENWTKIEVNVIVPSEATTLVIMLGATSSQMGKEGIYFDDLFVGKIYDPRMN